jgi:hypothetical protein
MAWTGLRNSVDNSTVEPSALSAMMDAPEVVAQ